MDKKYILLIVTIATCCIVNQTYALLKKGNPRETLENLGNTPLTQTKEEIQKQFSIANKKVIKLKKQYNLTSEQKTKHETALKNCRIRQPKKQKFINKLCMFKQTFQFCNNCSAQEIKLYGHIMKKNDPNAHPLGGSFGKYIEMQRKYNKANDEKNNFKEQLLACNSVQCYNDLLAELEEWNKKNKI